MGNLPNKTFVFNFNAKNYNASTYTIPKESGATMQEDMVWTGSTRGNIVAYDDHIFIPASAYTYWNFGSDANNPMNLTGTSKNLTVVFKVKLGSGGNARGTFLGNRGESRWNYCLRIGTESGYNTKNINFSAASGAFAEPSGLTYNSATTLTAACRISNMQVELMNLGTGEKNTPFTTSVNNTSVQFTLFGYKGNYAYVNEPMSGDFYWIYASREVLTDDEIAQVVRYNDSNGIDIDSTGTTIAQSGGTSTANIESETGWTVTTKPTWVTVSPSSGESGTTAITFTIKKNNFSSRTGVVVFTDDNGDEAEYTIEQGGTENQLPYNKIYRNDRRIN